MKTTPLIDEHKQLKGKLVEFAGYQMPVSYAAIKDEYEAVRQACGIFDISHMAPILFEGSTEDVFALINYVTCKDIAEIDKGEVQYNALIKEDGGVVDDITVYQVEDGRYALIVNASNRDNVLNFLSEWCKKRWPQVSARAASDYVLIAVQGPSSEAMLEAALAKQGHEFPEIYYYECAPLQDDRIDLAMVSRTGYTGEDGFEVLLPSEAGIQLWQDLLAEGAIASGLAARDLLRLEMFYPLYGHELRADWTPYQGGIGWLVSGDKEFCGKDAVMASKDNLPGRVRGFKMLEDGIPRAEYKVVDEDGNEIGAVTSGAFSFGWNCGFGMAYVQNDHSKVGTHLFIDVRGKKKPMEVLGKSPQQGSVKRRPK